MINIITALYCEAEPMIRYYQLKKDTEYNKFHVFQKDEIRLIITNTGCIAAAAGVSYFCTLHPPASTDILINIGVCAAKEKKTPVGSIFLCNKITEEATGRSFYPDILYEHPFCEENLITCSRAVKGYETEKQDVKLYDMEAAGIYQAAAYFIKPHQIYFLKIVSDYGMEQGPNSMGITELVEKNMPVITSWIEQLSMLSEPDKPLFTTEEARLIENISSRLQCSVTMEHKLVQLLHYNKLVHGNLDHVMKELNSIYDTQCKTKAEGKRCFEQLKERLL